MNYDSNTLEQAIVTLAVQAQQAALTPTVFQQLQQTQAVLAKTQEQLQQASEGLQAKDATLVALTKERDEARTTHDELVTQLKAHDIWPLPPAPAPTPVPDAPAGVSDNEGGDPT